jgi:hypothetical protein
MSLKAQAKTDMYTIFKSLDTETMQIVGTNLVFEGLLPAISPFAPVDVSAAAFEQTRVPSYFEIPVHSDPVLIETLSQGRGVKVVCSTHTPPFTVSVHRWSLSQDPLLLRFYIKATQ